MVHVHVINDNSKCYSFGIYKKDTTSTQYKPNLYLFTILYTYFIENLRFLSNCSINNCF